MLKSYVQHPTTPWEIDRLKGSNKNSEYDQEIPQSQTADNLWHHREEEPLNHHKAPGRQIKQSNQLSLPHQDDCITRMDTKQRTTKQWTIQTPTMGVTMNKKSTTTEPPP